MLLTVLTRRHLAASEENSIYADYNATAPVEPAHYQQVIDQLKIFDGNPSSIHRFGRTAKIALEEARTALATLLGARGPEIVFTSGATESNNMVIRGLVDRRAKEAAIPRLVVTAGEHSSVLETAGILAERGQCALSVAPITSAGVVDAEALLAQIDGETALVCLIHVNNEVGAINSVRELAEQIKVKAPQVHVHVDAVQALGKLDLSWLGRSKIDSAAVSGHKIGGFKGTGALFIASGKKLATLVMGGGQERARRAGTENMPGIISFGLRARELAADPSWSERERGVQQALLKALRDIPGAVVHGDPSRGVANTVNFHVDGLAGDDILLNFDLAGIAASSGSACSSGVGRPSHVLRAMGYSEWVSLNSVRLSFGARSCAGDVEQLITVLKGVIRRLQSSSAGNVRESQA